MYLLSCVSLIKTILNTFPENSFPWTVTNTLFNYRLCNFLKSAHYWVSIFLSYGFNSGWEGQLTLFPCSRNCSWASPWWVPGESVQCLNSHKNACLQTGQPQAPDHHAKPRSVYLFLKKRARLGTAPTMLPTFLILSLVLKGRLVWLKSRSKR